MSATSATVRVPATTANLGPGFDSLGMALDITQTVTLSIAPAQEQSDGLSRLVLDAARSAYRLAHVPAPPELRVESEATIPIGRGLGASAAARAAGIVGANALMGGPLTEAQTLSLGAGLEGHADNMAPALFGGLRVVVRTDAGYTHIAAPIASGLRVVLFVPEFDMPTSEGRKLLPQTVSQADAVHNIGRAALLVAALAAGDWSVLEVATQDKLHQPARTAIFPAMPEIFAAAKGAGALCAYLSGAGSTIAAFAVDGADAIAAAMATRAGELGYPGESIVASPSGVGAAVLAAG